MLRRDLLTQIHTYVFLMLPDTANQTTPSAKNGVHEGPGVPLNQEGANGDAHEGETVAQMTAHEAEANQRAFQLSPQPLSVAESDFLKQLNDSSPSFKLFMRFGAPSFRPLSCR